MPLTEEDLDGSSGVLFPFYDVDTNLLYIVGKVSLAQEGGGHLEPRGTRQRCPRLSPPGAQTGPLGGAGQGQAIVTGHPSPGESTRRSPRDQGFAGHLKLVPPNSGSRWSLSRAL